jgi:hypothetical protein
MALSRPVHRFESGRERHSLGRKRCLPPSIAKINQLRDPPSFNPFEWSPRFSKSQ